MHNEFAPPAYGKPVRLPQYYIEVGDIINALRGHASLATIASHLNSQGITSPRGKQWVKATVANFLRKTNIN